MLKSFFDRLRGKPDDEKEKELVEEDSVEKAEDSKLEKEPEVREELVEEEKNIQAPGVDEEVREDLVEEEKLMQGPGELEDIREESVEEEKNVQASATQEDIREDLVDEEKNIQASSIQNDVRQDLMDEEKNIQAPTAQEEIIEETKIEEKVELEEESEENVSFFGRLKQGLQKTRDQLANQIDEVLAPLRKVDSEMMEELEEILITSDLGVQTTMTVMDTLEERIRVKNIQDSQEVKDELVDIIIGLLREKDLDHSLALESPTVILVVGVNGVGKTTSIGKMAHRFKNEGKNVLMVAADTFRAAAIEQLQEWGTRADVPVIAHQEGSDPAAVIYDGIQAARSRKADILLCDTAGRLHNKANLMNELEKINRIIDRDFPEANKEVYIVVDGTTGQNAILQAREFKSVTDVSGAIITKLDGTARGGMVIPLELEEEIPVKLIGIGEQIEDLVDFVQEDFVEAIIK